MRRVPWLCVTIVMAACGSAPARPVVATPPPAPVVSYEASAPSGQRRTTGSIARPQLVAVLDAGLGRFLQGVVTEPDLVGGRFVGFRVESLYPNDERFSDLDLVAGDTITRVNGATIERPEQALAVWNELRVASELRIDYVRAGEARTLRFEIQD